MNSNIIEVSYPLTFREAVAVELGNHIQHQHSVEIVGMKRVGINNFLRFFLFHENIKKQYMPQDGGHFFILIDLNDLIERELFPFWRLTFKRIVDAVDKSMLSEKVKKKISDLFVASIQTGDLFLTYDGVREALSILANENLYPTLFLTRFDRLKDSVTPEFFHNLESLKDATQQKLSYIFTGYRELDTLVPTVFHRKDMTLFSNIMYIKPISEKDSEVILDSIALKYKLTISKELKNHVFALAGGHVQYLQLAALILHDLNAGGVRLDESSVSAAMLSDERVLLQSEELWESLTDREREVLHKIFLKERITEDEKTSSKYLWDTGFVKDTEIFSNIFEEFVKSQDAKRKSGTTGFDLSKKEHNLFMLLQQFPNEICEREVIVEKVWPEYKEYGVSDWSIDRLVARLRGKLRKQKSMYEISTVRTRGYRLTTR